MSYYYYLAQHGSVSAELIKNYSVIPASSDFIYFGGTYLLVSLTILSKKQSMLENHCKPLYRKRKRKYSYVTHDCDDDKVSVELIRY